MKTRGGWKETATIADTGIVPRIAITWHPTPPALLEHPGPLVEHRTDG